MIGRKLKIWDDDEQRWNSGRVTGEKAKGRVRVVYEDDEVEELCLDDERFEWVIDDVPTPGLLSPSPDKTLTTCLSREVTRAAPAAKSQKRRQVAESDDEAEFDPDDDDGVGAHPKKGKGAELSLRLLRFSRP
jgi:hypothetical protein